MLLFRSLVLGLLGACFCLLVARPSVHLRIPASERDIVYRPAPPAATIVDVAPALPPGQLGALVRLGPGEHVTAVSDQPVRGDVDAGAAIATVATASEASHRERSFVDLTVGGGRGGERRVVLLLH